MPAARWPRMRTQALRLATLLLIAGAALQAYFGARVALMAVVDPASTAFQRSEAWRLLSTQGRVPWSQTWVDDARISNHLKRAVIASEDARFVEHDGVDWDALEQAWERNLRALERAEQRPGRPLRLVGGSTITQQLAKNLFLSPERTVLRKAQEFVVTHWLELLLPKRRILEIYLNHVEWGEGVFGAQAAARHYFRTDAGRLGVMQAARLAVMLPAPKRFERRPHSAFLLSRAATVAARMDDVELP